MDKTINKTDTMNFFNEELKKTKLYNQRVQDLKNGDTDFLYGKIGYGTGLLMNRGHYFGQQSKSPIAYDFYSLRMNNIGFGATGEGKTKTIISTLLTSISKMIAENNVYQIIMGKKPYKLGMFIQDGKAKLYQDVVKHKYLKHRKDVKIIGTEKGHCFVDLTVEMTPSEMKSSFEGVYTQLAGQAKDGTWKNYASALFGHCALICLILKEYKEEVENWSCFEGKKIYSMSGVYSLLSDDNNIKKANKFIDEKLQAGEITETVFELTTGFDYIMSREYLDVQWTGGALPNETKGSIMQAVNTVFGTIAGAGKLSRFFTGYCEDAEEVDLDYCLNGGVLLCAVGEAGDNPQAGKLVATWLSSRLKVLARRKEIERPEDCKTDLCAHIIDEFQLIATTGGVLTDSGFWNVARSTGLFLVALTQSYSALEEVFGATGLENFLANCRNRFCMRIEDMKTIQKISEYAGKTLRGDVFEENFYENFYQRELDKPDTFISPKSIIDNSSNWSVKAGAKTTISTSVKNSIVSFAGAVSGKGHSNKETGSFGNPTPDAIFERQEAKEKQAIEKGLSLKPTLEPDELLYGGGLVFGMVQSMASYRVDMIDMEAVSKEFENDNEEKWMELSKFLSVA
ncbi:TraM recognition domain-containing protein [Gluconobacter cerinus]|uniref:TraM recognition domain-containing protein n=1 Tax=Gluconobacter cerinus TaxID=38307 RepID=UPI001B8C0560|nr:TraM recognition domain-containing protein [Gluconobacter cerinus]MBS1038110.1 TraM recognition domain-containing protein [Gluconobacter cerinus]